MGKNSLIKSLSRVIGNVVMHKLLLVHTNKPESIHHLFGEVMEYGAEAFEKSQEFNWNEKDIEEIRTKAITRVNNLSVKYSDVKLNDEEIERLINETIDELML